MCGRRNLLLGSHEVKIRDEAGKEEPPPIPISSTFLHHHRCERGSLIGDFFYWLQVFIGPKPDQFQKAILPSKLLHWIYSMQWIPSVGLVIPVTRVSNGQGGWADLISNWYYPPKDKRPPSLCRQCTAVVFLGLTIRGCSHITSAAGGGGGGMANADHCWRRMEGG